jgi:hypothetical protein
MLRPASKSIHRVPARPTGTRFWIQLSKNVLGPNRRPKALYVSLSNLPERALRKDRLSESSGASRKVRRSPGTFEGPPRAPESRGKVLKHAPESRETREPSGTLHRIRGAAGRFRGSPQGSASPLEDSASLRIFGEAPPDSGRRPNLRKRTGKLGGPPEGSVARCTIRSAPRLFWKAPEPSGSLPDARSHAVSFCKWSPFLRISVPNSGSRQFSRMHIRIDLLRYVKPMDGWVLT